MTKYLYAFFLIPALLLMLPPTKMKADDVIVGDDDGTNTTVTYITLAWDSNTETDLAGYNVYYGRASGDYARVETVTGATAVIGVRGNATVYFAVTAFDTNGLESDLSTEVHWP